MENEKRLIDADRLYDAIERRYQVSGGIEHRCERNLLDLICAAETVDAVEVVRCKDCKNQTAMWCWRKQEDHTPFRVGSDDFCSYGERSANG